MSLIEQAAKRLEQLKNAGVDLGDGDLMAARGSTESVESDGGTRVPEAVVREFEARERALGQAMQSDRAAAVSRKTSIDLAHLAAAGMVTPDAPRSQIADEFRIIKRPLLGNAQRRSAAPGPSANLIMITSALGREGKTFTAM